MRRVTLRARLALAVALAMAAVLAGVGLFVDLRVQRSLSGAVDQGLRARAVDVASLAAQADNGLSTTSAFTRAGQGFGQLIESSGRVFDATPGLDRRPLLDRAQLARVRTTPDFMRLDGVPGGPARALVEAIHAQDQRLVLVVGTSLAPELGTLSSLRTGLLIACPVALLLTTLGGYLLAGAALRPVERMRSRAASLSAERHGARLPIPHARDEISRLGRTLNEMLARLERAREHEQRFLADASHELRTPLTLLKTELELALDGPHSASELTLALRSSADEVDRLTALAEDLLLLAQIDQGVLPIRPVGIDAAELASRLATRFQSRAERDCRQIAVSVPTGLSLHADPLRIEQALANLLDNALRHGCGTIQLTGTQINGSIELTVSDEGPGIAAAIRPRAFERFTCADPGRGSAGTGLGLAIVSAIARAHNGQAVLGDGAEVTLRVPAERLAVRAA